MTMKPNAVEASRVINEFADDMAEILDDTGGFGHVVIAVLSGPPDHVRPAGSAAPGAVTGYESSGGGPDAIR
jgi:hypothetical protein